MLLKQGAILGLIVCFAWLAYDWFQHRRPRTGSEARAAKVVASAAMLAVVVWYGYKFFQMRAGIEASNLYGLMQTIHAGRNYLQRLAYAALLIWHARGITGPMVARVFGILCLAGFAVRSTRPIMLWLVAPFLLCWALWFSYEFRTVSAVVPFVGLVAGLVMSRGNRTRSVEAPQGRSGALLAAAFAGHRRGLPEARRPAPPHPVTLGLLMPYFKDMWTIGAVSIYTPWLMCAGGGDDGGDSCYRRSNGALHIWWPPLSAL